MELVWNGLIEAFKLIMTFDKELFIVVKITLKVCLSAIGISTLIGVPMGMILGLKEFPGKRLILSIINLGMGVPPVVVGLAICVLFWRSGPFGQFDILFTQKAIILAQVVLSLPIVTGFVSTAFQSIDKNLILLVRSMGATKIQTTFIYLRQVRFGIFAAVIAGLGRVLAEVGAAQMVGASVYRETTILTTTIVQQVNMGRFDVAMAVSFILLAISFLLTAFLTFLQKGGKKA
ncbi:MAG: ABC-type tungstate transport permease protein [Bacillales bacterium]|jgi:tungstate transport system permease protein|nr:ABC-type tungstate transport permease protein [Bacillales bacterium]